jgi:hypothetical protein
MGDGVLVYFGYPQAHEDDAERAVNVTAIGALQTHAPLQTRIGIATGLVVVGDLIGSGASQEQHFADHLIAERGVRHGRPYMVPVEIDHEAHSHAGKSARRHSHVHVHGKQ